MHSILLSMPYIHHLTYVAVPTSHCRQTAKGQALKKAEQQHVILITLADGPCPTKSVHLYCKGHVEYSVCH
jgi:hypothetical protein